MAGLGSTSNVRFSWFCSSVSGVVKSQTCDEPLFAALRGAGFLWRTANTPDQTRRLIPDGRPPPRARRIDWIFTRGLTASRPRTLAAVDEQGQPLSDHEVITVDIA